jgi:hypothetical protein
VKKGLLALGNSSGLVTGSIAMAPTGVRSPVPTRLEARTDVVCLRSKRVQGHIMDISWSGVEVIISLRMSVGIGERGL